MAAPRLPELPGSDAGVESPSRQGVKFDHTGSKIACLMD